MTVYAVLQCGLSFFFFLTINLFSVNAQICILRPRSFTNFHHRGRDTVMSYRKVLGLETWRSDKQILYGIVPLKWEDQQREVTWTEAVWQAFPLTSSHTPPAPSIKPCNLHHLRHGNTYTPSHAGAAPTPNICPTIPHKLNVHFYRA